MSVHISCHSCDDFGWIPRGGPKGWYRTDWRLLLDPTVTWQRCPDCSLGSSGSLEHVQECLSAVLLRRFLGEASHWQAEGPWRRGRWQDCVIWVYGMDLVMVGPGSANPHPWLLISALGVMQELSLETCHHHLQRAGIPPPPA